MHSQYWYRNTIANHNSIFFVNSPDLTINSHRVTPSIWLLLVFPESINTWKCVSRLQKTSHHDDWPIMITIISLISWTSDGGICTWGDIVMEGGHDEFILKLWKIKLNWFTFSNLPISLKIKIEEFPTAFAWFL